MSVQGRDQIEAAFSLGTLISEHPVLLREVENLVGNGQRTLLEAPASAPLMRQLIRVEFRMYGGQRWLYWYWTPESPKPGEDLSGLDCGYSGRRFPEGA